MAMRRKKGVAGAIALVVALATAASLLAAGGAGAGSQSAFALPREQTLYTSGKQWGPYTGFNPLRTGDYATGTLGLLYETLFRYDPLKDQFIPWLATNGKWVGRDYVLTVRPGVKWNDGKPFTAADVKFTFQTGKLTGSEYSTMWKTGLASITSKGNVVRFHFNARPNFQDWDTTLYNLAIVPQHIWSQYSTTDITTGNADTAFVGTGPFTYGAGQGRLPDAAVEPA